MLLSFPNPILRVSPSPIEPAMNVCVHRTRLIPFSTVSRTTHASSSSMLPLTYSLQSTSNAFLYISLSKSFPTQANAACPNTSFLLDQLTNTTTTNVSVDHPLSLLLDDHNYLATVSYANKSIVRFYPDNLTQINQPASPSFVDNPRSLAYHDGAYFVGFKSYILVVLSNNMTQIHNISASVLDGVRDMVFLRNGQLMIVSSADNDRLLLFNRSNVEPHNYDLIGFRNVTYKTPHGLLYIDDASFYAISYTSNNVYMYSNAGNATEWTESLALNASSVTGFSGGTYLSTDECDRFWLSLQSHGIWIFDSQGSHLGTLNITGVSMYDTLIDKNYVMYISDYASNRIIRIDPHIQC